MDAIANKRGLFTFVSLGSFLVDFIPCSLTKRTIFVALEYQKVKNEHYS